MGIQITNRYFVQYGTNGFTFEIEDYTNQYSARHSTETA